MALLHLDAGLLHFAVINACNTLIAQRSNLNAINIFPVADGDTGDNMAATARAIVTYAKAQSSVTATCQALADAGIMGARGNSGMIFSQFFNGLLESEGLPEQLNTLQFAAMITAACQSVRAAIIKPVEGTILTVMDAWANSLQRNAASTSCFILLLQQTIADVQTALQSTATTLAVLQEAHVVDAGALGFSFFIEGFANYLENPHEIEEVAQEVPDELHQHEAPVSGNPPLNRYCTEAVIAGKSIDKTVLGSMVQAHGDSIVLTANQHLCRLHVHSNQPSAVFGVLRQFGTVQYPKVDDMLRQYQVMHARRHKIALVTDSSVNLPQSILDDFQIHLIPLNVHCDGHDLIDRHCFNSNELYETLTNLKTYPTTSFPAPALINEKIGYLAQHFDEVLIVSVAKALSGTHNALSNAASPFPNVHVLDSRLVSGSQGLLLYYAAELIAEGADMEHIKKVLQEKSAKTHLFVMVDQLDSMIRSGRISKLKGRFAQFSGVKPIISFDEEGKGFIYDKALGENKALIKIVTTVSELIKTSGLDNYCIVHAGAQAKAEEFSRITTEAFGQEPVFIEPVSTVIGLHAGKGCIALGVMLH